MKKAIVQVELPADAWSTAVNLADKHGMPSRTLMSRMVEWFSGLPPDLQAKIMMKFASQDPEIVKEVLREMSRPQRK